MIQLDLIWQRVTRARTQFIRSHTTREDLGTNETDSTLEECNFGCFLPQTSEIPLRFHGASQMISIMEQCPLRGSVPYTTKLSSHNK